MARVREAVHDPLSMVVTAMLVGGEADRSIATRLVEGNTPYAP